MRRGAKIAAALIAAALLLACPFRRGTRTYQVPAEETGDSTGAFDEIADRALRQRWEMSPGRATALGVRGFDKRLPRLHAKAIKKSVDRLTQLVQELYALEPTELSWPEQIDRQLLIADLRLILHGYVEEGRPLYTPLDAVDEVIEALVALYLGDNRPLDKRLEAMAERLLQLPELLTAVRENLHNPAARDCSAALERSVALRAFIDADLRTLAQRAERDVGERLELGIDEALRGLDAFVKGLGGGCDSGPDLVPIGPDNYVKRMRFAHGVDVDAEAVIAVAEEWLHRSADALGRLELTPAPVLEPIADFDQRRAMEVVSGQVDSLWSMIDEREIAALPPTRTPLRAIALPPALRFAARPLSLRPAPAFGSGSALFLVGLLPEGDLAKSEQRTLQSLVHSGGFVLASARETFPGRQLQQLLARRQASTIRRTYRSTMLSDGWALYAAQLALDSGMVAADGETQRALLEQSRAVAALALVDARLHTGQIDFDQAVDFLAANTALPLIDTGQQRRRVLEQEVVAMLRAPTRASAALLGKLAIQELRDRAQAKKGAAFDLRRFHNAVLAQGTIPPAYIASVLFRDPLPILDTFPAATESEPADLNLPSTEE